MKRKSLDDTCCPIARALDQVGEWWSLLIVRDIALGKKRFGALQGSLGVARNILSARLKRLIGCGIVRLQPLRAGCAYQEYDLTEKGRDLLIILLALEQWGNRWVTPDIGATYKRVERATGEEIAPIAIRSRDGRPLSPFELGVLPREAGELHRRADEAP